MPRFRAVLFDLDGTLIDSVRLILDSYHHTLAIHGLPARSDQHWLEGMGTPLRAQFREWSDNPEQLEAMVSTYREYNLRHHDTRVAAYPGVNEMLQGIQSRGMRTALVTSKQREGALRGLRVTGLDFAINVVVGADDVTRAKPDREPVERALGLLGVAAGDTVFVGDSRHDIESGRSAGVVTAAALWGPFDRNHLDSARPDHWLERPMDLLALLGT